MTQPISGHRKGMPAEQGVAALEVVEAAACAARLGRAVTLDEVRLGV